MTTPQPNLEAEAKRAATEYTEAHALSSIEIAWYNGAQWMAKRVAEQRRADPDAPAPPDGYELLPKGDEHVVREGERVWLYWGWFPSVSVGRSAANDMYYCRPVENQGVECRMHDTAVLYVNNCPARGDNEHHSCPSSPCRITPPEVDE